MALFRVDFSGRGELADRQQKLAQMLSRLQKISEGNSRTVMYSTQPNVSQILSELNQLRTCWRHVGVRIRNIYSRDWPLEIPC